MDGEDTTGGAADDAARADIGGGCDHLLIVAGTACPAIAAMLAVLEAAGVTGQAAGAAVAAAPPAPADLVTVPARPSGRDTVLCPVAEPVAVAALTRALADAMASGARRVVLFASRLWPLGDAPLAAALAPAAGARRITLLVPLDAQREAWLRLVARAALALCRDADPPPWGVAAGMDHRLVAGGLHYDARLAVWERALETAAPAVDRRVLPLDGRDPDGAGRELARLLDLATDAATGAPAPPPVIEPLGWKAVALAEAVAPERPDCPARRRVWARSLADTAAAMAARGPAEGTDTGCGGGWRGPPPCSMDAASQESMARHYRASNRALLARTPALDFTDPPPRPRAPADILLMEEDEIAAARAHLDGLLARRDPLPAPRP